MFDKNEYNFKHATEPGNNQDKLALGPIIEKKNNILMSITDDYYICWLEKSEKKEENDTNC